MQSKIDRDILSLIKDDDRQVYQNAVLQMYNDYEKLVFNLSEQSKNETIDSIKLMSLGQRLKFQQLITERNRKMNKNGR